MEDGTEALSGDTGAAPPPGGTNYMDSQQSSPIAPATPAPAAAAPAAAAPSGQPVAPAAQAMQPTPATAAPAQQQVQPHRGFDLLDLLVNPKTQVVSINDQGQRVVQPGAPLSRGQQIAHLIATALEGASTAALAPPGPGHTAQGVAAATKQGLAQGQNNADKQNEQAQQDFDRQQKAKMDSINYQLLQRKVASAALDDRLAQTKADQETVTFSNQLLDREHAMGSFDLGTVKNAGEIASVISKLPDWEQKLYKEQALLPVPIYGADGKPQGLQLFLRKQDPQAMPAPPDTKVPKWVPGAPGEQPHTEYFTPVGASVKDIDNYNAKYLNDESSYRMGQATLAHTQAETKEAGARAVEAIANAGKAQADARKTRIEADNEEPGVDGAGGSIQQNAQMMVDGLSSPSQMSKRSKTYDQMLPAANAYSMQRYGVPFDAEISEGRYQARKKTIADYGSGKEGDQIQSLNTFFGHAANLSATVNQLRSTNSPLINTPLKDLRKAMGDARYSQIEPLVYAVRKEYQNFVQNNRALHNEDITEGASMLNDDQSLAQMQGAIKSFGGVALTRAGQLNQRYARVVGKGDVPGLVDDGTKKAINSLGLGNFAAQELGGAYTGQPQQPQQQATPAAAAPAVGPVQPGEHVSQGPKGTIVLRNNVWVDPKTGRPPQ